MNAAQADRARIAARAGARRSTGRAAINPLARITVVEGGGNVRNRRAPRLTAAQRNSEGRRSEWAMSPYAPFGGWR